MTDDCMMNGGPGNEAAPDFVREWKLTGDDGAEKTLRLVAGDLCALQGECDVVVCSAFRNDYMPTFRSLIGGLYWIKDINVAELAADPELDFRAMGCWLSRDTGREYRRVACVELLDSYARRFENPDRVDHILRRSFSTLRFILEQAEIAGIPVESVALPILGTGTQSIDLEYVLGPLIVQCGSMLRTNPGIKQLTVYERRLEMAEQAAKALDAAFSKADDGQRVFISYSSRQTAQAMEIAELLRGSGISCWMAPGSIPAGSSYQEAIPVAIGRADVVLMLLTPDAEKSRWVQKEIGSAIGADKVLLPYMLTDFVPGEQLRFLLDGEQIMPCAGDHAPLVERLRAILDI